MRFEDFSEFCIYSQNLFRHTSVTALAISMLNVYRDIENAFKIAVITLKKYD